MNPERRHDVNETADARELREADIERVAEEKAILVARHARGAGRRDLVLLAALFAAMLYGATLIAQVSSIDSARATCDRANNSRVATLGLLQDLVDVNVRRIEAARSEGDTETLKAQQYAKRQYQGDLDAYVEAQAPAAFEPGSPTPDGVRADCIRVNPYPWPL
jgi:hypothetical protein